MSHESERAISLCQELIRIPSLSGQEGAVANHIQRRMLEMGFDEVRTDDYGSVIGRIRGSRLGKAVLFDGHMDTVPVSDESQWKYPPFAAEIHDRKMYGRGASDMKGALAAMICAAASFLEDTGRDFAGDIYVAGVVHEECFEGVAAREVSKYVKPDLVVIGEASSLNVKIGQRGRAELKLEVFGKAAHSANPDKGVNAVYKILKAIDEIRRLEPKIHPVLGKGILELTDIKSHPYPGASVVPEYCVATFDRRLLIGETRETVLAPLEALLERMKREDPELDAKVSCAAGEERCYTQTPIRSERFFPGWLYERDEAFIVDAVRELRAAGFDPEVTQYNFCTNASHYAGEAGIKTIGMGPSRENLAHTLNEYIEVDQLLKAVECYRAILKAWMK